MKILSMFITLLVFLTCAQCQLRTQHIRLNQEEWQKLSSLEEDHVIMMKIVDSYFYLMIKGNPLAPDFGLKLSEAINTAKKTAEELEKYKVKLRLKYTKTSSSPCIFLPPSPKIYTLRIYPQSIFFKKLLR